MFFGRQRCSSYDVALIADDDHHRRMVTGAVSRSPDAKHAVYALSFIIVFQGAQQHLGDDPDDLLTTSSSPSYRRRPSPWGIDRR
jgi:hypothetical protein